MSSKGTRSTHLEAEDFEQKWVPGDFLSAFLSELLMRPMISSLTRHTIS